MAELTVDRGLFQVHAERVASVVDELKVFFPNATSAKKTKSMNVPPPPDMATLGYWYVKLAQAAYYMEFELNEALKAEVEARRAKKLEKIAKEHKGGQGKTREKKTKE